MNKWHRQHKRYLARTLVRHRAHRRWMRRSMMRATAAMGLAQLDLVRATPVDKFAAGQLGKGVAFARVVTCTVTALNRVAALYP